MSCLRYLGGGRRYCGQIWELAGSGEELRDGLKGLSEVFGNAVGMGILRGQTGASGAAMMGNQEGGDARGLTGGDVVRIGANHEGIGKAEVPLTCRAEQQAWLWLAALAILCVRIDDTIEIMTAIEDASAANYSGGACTSAATRDLEILMIEHG